MYPDAYYNDSDCDYIVLYNKIWLIFLRFTSLFIAKYRKISEFDTVIKS